MVSRVTNVPMVAFATLITKDGYGNVPEEFPYAYISCLVLSALNFALSLPRCIKFMVRKTRMGSRKS
jgi:hypothetical protein